MAEISMIQTVSPAAPAASADKTKSGVLETEFSELLRDKGQSVADGGKKTEGKETEQSRTRQPVKKPDAEKEEQEEKEPVSAPEYTEENLSVLAGMVFQAQMTEDRMPEEEFLPEAALPGITETAPVPAYTPPAEDGAAWAREAVFEETGPVPEGGPIQTIQIYDPAAEGAAKPEEPVSGETALAAEAVSQKNGPEAVSQRYEPEAVSQKNGPEAVSQKSETSPEDTVRSLQEDRASSQSREETDQDIPEEDRAIQAEQTETRAIWQDSAVWQPRPAAEEESVPADRVAVRTSESTLPRDVAETLGRRMPSSGRELILELEPAALGRIVIKAVFEDGKTVLSLITDQDRTLTVLSQRAGEIAQILEEKTGQQTVIYTPENQAAQEELPEKGGEGRRERQDGREPQRERENESFVQQLRLGLTG